MKVYQLFDNLINPSLIRKCKKALDYEAKAQEYQKKYNDLSTSVEEQFYKNYSTDEIEEIFNICEAYAHPKQAEAIKEIHLKYLDQKKLSPAELLLVGDAYKINVKRMKEDGAIKYNYFIMPTEEKATEE